MAEQSYSHEIPLVATASLSLTGGAATQRTLPVMQSFRITRIRVVASTAVTVADSTVTVNREIKYGSSSNQVAIGVFTVPHTSSTLGDVTEAYVWDVADTLIMPGEGISFVTNGLSTAGVVWCAALGFYYGDSRLPNSVRSFTSVSKPESGSGSMKYATFTAS